MLTHGLKKILLACAMLPALALSQWIIPTQPLSIQPAAKPLIMLGLGRDHRMFYEAYNDASDIDGDGTLDIRFKPAIIYLGLFNSDYCYTHDGDASSSAASATNTQKFVPSGVAGADKKCPGKWSGNWLNYVTTSRIDALKVVLFGGTREVDTSSSTILRRTYIPQDAHSWAKEYESFDNDKYNISDYTPLAQPTIGKRHFFGNLTANAGINCATLSTCSDLPPWLSVVTNSDDRVWNWASTERPVLRDNTHRGTRRNYTVRVEVCTSGYSSIGCKLYPSGSLKPVGLLHDFGEDEAALFGLITGSYDNHLAGGRLRKVMSSFKNELTTTTGVFDASVQGIVSNLNAFRILGFNRSRTDNAYQGSVFGDRAVNEGEFPDWGNPIAELMYEATRYFANKGSATAAYNTRGTTNDDILGLSKPSWDRPYTGQGTSTAAAPYCARANLLTISDTNISFDSDQLPGVNVNFGSGIATDLSGNNVITGVFSSLNVSEVADFITPNETGITGQRFVGQSGANFDSAPTAKTVGSLSSLRGLAPEEATKRGSYYAASVAAYTKATDLNSTLQGPQTIDHFLVALASPLPKIEAKLPNGSVLSLVPFGKSVGGCFSIVNTKGTFQPTHQIVDFYVQSIANSGPRDIDTAKNGGRYEAKFRINFEDVEQGNDHDMDGIVEYTVRANVDNTLEVTVQTQYDGTCALMRYGYILSGSTADGIYLVTQSRNDTTPYFLNVPPGRAPGYCDVSSPPADCTRLPYLGGSTTVTATTSLSAATSSISRFVFSPSSASAATFLKDPLWYAAKWGGFNEFNQNGKPDLKSEWDTDNDGLPDTYFFVQNPTKLRDSLTKAFRSIVERQGSSSNLAANVSGRIDTDSKVYRASYTAGKWIGEVEALPITITGIGTSPVWRASEEIPAWSARNLLMQTSDGNLVSMQSTAFGSLPLADRDLISSVDIYAYLKGDKSKETKAGGGFRDRDNLLGDIIHSSPAYDLDSRSLYVGSNGGFLHSFDGDTGVEKFGLMPKAVVPRVKNLSAPAYQGAHEYFVDGENLLGFKFAETNNTYYLYTMLGRGGKGLLSINPGLSATFPTILWDYSAPTSSTTTLTATLSVAELDPDLGLMLSSGFSSLTNNNGNGKYAVFAGNGYNSTSGKAVLYAFLMNADGTLNSVRKLDTGVAGKNGMAGPSGFDINADGKVDFVYAGDLLGNLWKFDVRDGDPANWKLAYAGNVPMFKATDASGKPQPITAPVAVVFNNFSAANPGLLHITFGTGSYFRAGDNADLSIQSWYGIVDDQADFASTSSPVTTTAVIRSALAQRYMSSPVDATTGFTIRYAGGEVTGDMAGKRGWYIDWLNPVNGERIITKNSFIPNAVKPSLQSTSFYPVTDDICRPGGESYVNAIDPTTGTNLKEDYFLSLPVGGTGTVGSIGPKASNPAPLSGAEHVDLRPSSRKLSIGIATTPLNLATGGSASTDDLWLTSVGINNYGSPNLPTRNSDYNRWNDRVAAKKDKLRKDCTGNLVSVISGSEGIDSGGIKGCETNKIQGRISWREILKD
jgi:type IV pilus assembly protein PilY1